MRQFQKLLVLPLACLMAMSTSAFAQQHVVSQDILTAAVTDHIAAQEGGRNAVRTALQHPQVRGMAAKMGVDLTRAEAAVATMSGADLERAAVAARQVNDTLAGGASTIVISTTTVIIALLVIIIILVAD